MVRWPKGDFAGPGGLARGDSRGGLAREGPCEGEQSRGASGEGAIQSFNTNITPLMSSAKRCCTEDSRHWESHCRNNPE